MSLILLIISNPVDHIFFLHLFLVISDRIAESYLKHPNSYLPKYNANSETDGETTPLNATDTNRNSGGSNVFESEEELDDQIEEEGWFPILVKKKKTIEIFN